MSDQRQSLYDLVPRAHRIRDTELAIAALDQLQQRELLETGTQSGPLKALLDVIAAEVDALNENLEQLYDDQFIETCADWVVPYIGDLIGYRLLHGATARTSRRKSEVANTIAYRRRKGTAAVLEQLARDVTGWHARVVEFFELLATTQFMNHIRPHNRSLADLRDWRLREHKDSAFDSAAHTVDVRQVASGSGRYNIPNIGIFLWRIDAFAATDVEPVVIDDRRFLFSPLGNNIELFNRPVSEEQITHIAALQNVPHPISRRLLFEDLTPYFGMQRSFSIAVAGVEVDMNDIQVCDLSDQGGGWAHHPEDRISVDPQLGRITFPLDDPAPADLTVRYHYGFSSPLGGGEYDRSGTLDGADLPKFSVHRPGPLQAALDQAQLGGVVEIEDSGLYAEALSIAVDAERKLELRSANQKRASLVLNGDLTILGGERAEVELNGLLISGGSIRVPGNAGNRLSKLVLRHCTLVPGLTLDVDGAPISPDSPSLIVARSGVTVELDHCIVGGIRAAAGTRVSVDDSIVDATRQEGVAFAAANSVDAGGELTVNGSTVIGKVHTRNLKLVSNSVFAARTETGDGWSAPVVSSQKQDGCVRFSYMPRNAWVPRRYRVQPNLAIKDAIEQDIRDHPGLSQTERDQRNAQIRARIGENVRPVFTTQRYGAPAYCQLSQQTREEIRRGADDESEMGAFHDLFQPQREANLRIRLDEYLRFGLEAGVFCAS